MGMMKHNARAVRTAVMPRPIQHHLQTMMLQSRQLLQPALTLAGLTASGKTST